MARVHHYKRHKEPPELDVTTFLNLMVVLIPFLLITAVFSRITIQELHLPEAAAGGSEADWPLVIIEVIVRKGGLEVGDGKNVVAALPKVDGKYDLAALSRVLLRLKSQYAAKQDATILVEPEIAYEDVIHVMDVMKVAEVREEEEEPQRLVLFPELSIGDAP